MYVQFLDLIDHQILDQKEVVSLFKNIQPQQLEYSNTGYFMAELAEQGNIILLFWWLDTTRLVFRLDRNIPNVQQGASYLSWNGGPNTPQIDVGDDTYFPENASISVQQSLLLIDAFFNDPTTLPTVLTWQNVE